jgi:signal transduction histidine kinase
MVNMRDRISSVGGKLTVDSHTGQGTRVNGRIPLLPPARMSEARVDGRPQRSASPGRRRDHTPS